MTNKEFNKEGILEVACDRGRVAIDKITNKPRNCELMACGDCLFDGYNGTCRDALAKWLEEEYVEPCPFEEGELVEVSDDRKIWYLEYFVNHTDGMYETREHKEEEMTSKWIYCQKYGTLGGLVKGEQ